VAVVVIRKRKNRQRKAGNQSFPFMLEPGESDLKRKELKGKEIKCI